ncbi:MAG: beta-lactamase family protein [Polyangiaceae bacterium]|nr:beta-lactamase family protein [Polyangiaceae bacterium]
MQLAGFGRVGLALLISAATIGTGCDEDGDLAESAGAGGAGTGASAPGDDGGPTSGGQTAGPSTGTGATGAGGSVPSDVVYPVPDWTVENPADHGIDPAALAAAMTAAESLESHCLVVVRHGVIVGEGYWQGKHADSTDKSFSVAKSYTSALVGIAIERGDIESLEQSASDFIPEWQGTEHESITIRHLLSMTSGLDWNLFSDYVAMATFSSNQSEYAVDLGQSEDPGSKWQYHNGGVQIFEPLFRGATGMTIEQYAAEHLWSRIGSSAHWNHDQSENPTTYAHVLATCRDHARFGYLYLRNGVWADGPVVPWQHVQASLTPSQSQNQAYGYLWWLNGHTPALDPFGQLKESTIAPFAPSDLFAARGFGDQFIDVIPSLDMVIVRIGPDPLAFGGDITDIMENESSSGTHESIVGPLLAGVSGD